MLQSHIGKVRIMPDVSTTVPSVAIQSQKNTKGILNNGSAVFVHTMKVSGVQKGHKVACLYSLSKSLISAWTDYIKCDRTNIKPQLTINITGSWMSRDQTSWYVRTNDIWCWMKFEVHVAILDANYAEIIVWS